MKFTTAIDEYIRDMRSAGRINSPRTEVSYRHRLNALGDDVGNRDPRTIGREDVKKSLRRWQHPNTQRNARAIFVSFFDWTMEEGIRKDNPARQTRRPKRRATTVYRLTREESVALMDAARPGRERWTIMLGLLCGLRNAELRGLRADHFSRPGWVHVSADIAKGNRERYVPVLPELEPVIAEILSVRSGSEFVLCSRRTLDPPKNTRYRDIPLQPMSPRAIHEMVAAIGIRAGIAAHVHPHLLRHAYGTHVARHAGLRVAQALLGHASVDTTAGTYVEAASLDDLADGVAGLTYRGYPPTNHPATPVKATTGIEPVVSASDGGMRVIEGGKA